MRFKKPGPNLSPDDVTRFENEIGVRLPDDYKQFLLDYNLTLHTAKINRFIIALSSQHAFSTIHPRYGWIIV